MAQFAVTFARTIRETGTVTVEAGSHEEAITLAQAEHDSAGDDDCIDWSQGRQDFVENTQPVLAEEIE